MHKSIFSAVAVIVAMSVSQPVVAQKGAAAGAAAGAGAGAKGNSGSRGSQADNRDRRGKDTAPNNQNTASKGNGGAKGSSAAASGNQRDASRNDANSSPVDPQKDRARSFERAIETIGRSPPNSTPRDPQKATAERVERTIREVGSSPTSSIARDPQQTSVDVRTRNDLQKAAAERFESTLRGIEPSQPSSSALDPQKAAKERFERTLNVVQSSIAHQATQSRSNNHRDSSTQRSNQTDWDGGSNNEIGGTGWKAEATVAINPSQGTLCIKFAAGPKSPDLPLTGLSVAGTASIGGCVGKTTTAEFCLNGSVSKGPVGGVGTTVSHGRGMCLNTNREITKTTSTSIGYGVKTGALDFTKSVEHSTQEVWRSF